MDRRCNWMLPPYMGLFLAITVVLCLVQTAEQTETSVSWSETGVVTVRQGESLSLTCTVSGFSAIDLVRITHIQGQKRHTISDYAATKPPYSSLSRYHVKYNDNGNTAVATISYNGIQPEDSGMLECQKQSRGPIQNSFVNITVLVTVSDIYIVAILPDGSHTHANGKAVVLEENQDMGVGCVALANGSATAPEMHITIGKKDATSSFQSTTNTSLVLLDSGLSLFITQVKMTLVTSRPEPEYNGKTIKCSAVLSNGEMDATAVLSVKYAPIIECSDLEHFVRVGDEVTVACDVKANPSSRIEWQFAGETDDILLDHDNIIFNQTKIDGDRVHAEMTITDVEESEICLYSLTATNEIGTANVTVELTKALQAAINQPQEPVIDSSVGHGNLEKLKQNQVNPEPTNGVIEFQFSVILLSFHLTVITSLYFL